MVLNPSLHDFTNATQLCQLFKEFKTLQMTYMIKLPTFQPTVATTVADGDVTQTYSMSAARRPRVYVVPLTSPDIYYQVVGNGVNVDAWATQTKIESLPGVRELKYVNTTQNVNTTCVEYTQTAMAINTAALMTSASSSSIGYANQQNAFTVRPTRPQWHPTTNASGNDTAADQVTNMFGPNTTGWMISPALAIFVENIAPNGIVVSAPVANGQQPVQPRINIEVSGRLLISFRGTNPVTAQQDLGGMDVSTPGQNTQVAPPAEPPVVA